MSVLTGGKNLQAGKLNTKSLKAVYMNTHKIWPLEVTYDFYYTDDESTVKSKSVSNDGDSFSENITSVTGLSHLAVPFTYSVDEAGSGWIDIQVNEDSVDFTVDSNSEYWSRTGVVTFLQDCSEKTLTYQITQQAHPEPIYEFYYTDQPSKNKLTKSVSNSEMSFEQGITSQTNEGLLIPFDISGTTNWCTVAETGNGVSFDISENTETTSRNTTVTFTQETTDKQLTYEITQEAMPEPEPTYEFYYTDHRNELSLSKSIGESGETFEEGITSEMNGSVLVPYSISGTTEWCSVNETESGASFNVSSNASENERSTVVKFTQQTTEKELTYNITQAGHEVEPEPEPVTYEFYYTNHSSQDSLSSTVEHTGTTITEPITSKDSTGGSVNYTSSVSGSSSWIAVSQDTITVSANTEEEEREATVTFKQDITNDTLTYKVTQNGKPAPVPDTYEFEWNGISETTKTATTDVNGQASVTITDFKSTKNGSFQGFTATTTDNWITVTETSSTGASFTFKTNAADSETSRTGTITLKQRESNKLLYYKITQQGNEYVFKWDSGNETTSSMSVDVGASSATITGFTSTKNGTFHKFSASTSTDWISSVTASGNETKVTFNHSANDTETQKTGTITLKQNDSDKTLTLNVTKAGKEHVPVYVFEFDGSKTVETFSATADGSNTTFGVTSKKDNTVIQFTSAVEPGSDWLTATVNNNTKVTVQAQANDTEVQRTGKITLTQSESQKTITINATQAAKEHVPTIQFEFDDGTDVHYMNVSADGLDEETVGVMSYIDEEWTEFTVSCDDEWVTATYNGVDFGVDVTVDPNDSLNERSTTITLTQNDPEGGG